MISAPFNSSVNSSERVRGFTLVELAIALFVVVLVLGGILVPLTTQANQRKVSDTQRSLDETNEALTGFAIANGYLPCPAISATDGQEDRTAGVCTAGKRQGFIPWTTLGVSKLDAWGNIFRYSVTPGYTSSAAPFTLGTAPDITIQTRTADGTALTNLTNANTVTAVVLSHANNAYGATNSQGVVQALPAGWPASNSDENTNSTGTTIFVSRAPQREGASGLGGEFDDIVAWLPRFSLVNRMVSGGKLP
jgi:type II secretory pathway pseudopilin PulG